MLGAEMRGQRNPLELVGDFSTSDNATTAQQMSFARHVRAMRPLASGRAVTHTILAKSPRLSREYRFSPRWAVQVRRLSPAQRAYRPLRLSHAK